MATNEPADLEFQGKDLKECEQFIKAVNKQARAEGKLRDDAWIADLVATCVAGDALIWWSSLDEETQESWKLLRKAMLSRYRLRFAGKSGAEAEEFVDWIRERALDAGKLDDPIWPAKLASGCFMGSALRWYTALDLGIRGDWDSLQQAIFLQYSQDFKEGSSPPIVPTPALAAADSTLSKRRVRGRIRIQRKDESASYYVSKILQAKGSEPGRVRVTASLSEALEVEYDSLPPSDDPRTLFIPDNQLPGCDALGMKWFSADSNPSYIISLCGVDLSSGTGSPGPSYKGPLLTKPWKILRPANSQATTTSLWAISQSGARLSPQSATTYIEFVAPPHSATDTEIFFESV